MAASEARHSRRHHGALSLRRRGRRGTGGNRRRREGRVLRARGRRDSQDHQGTARDPRPPGRGPGRRRHYLPGLPRGRGLSPYARRLLRLPELDGNLAPRHREFAQALHSRSAGGPSRLTDNFESCLDQLFLSARTHNAWRERGVPDALLHHIVDLAKLGPTSANCSPARFLFVKSRAAKERLKPYLCEGNRDKTMKAPVCATISTSTNICPGFFPTPMAMAMAAFCSRARRASNSTRWRAASFKGLP